MNRCIHKPKSLVFHYRQTGCILPSHALLDVEVDLVEALPDEVGDAVQHNLVGGSAVKTFVTFTTDPKVLTRIWIRNQALDISLLSVCDQCTGFRQMLYFILCSWIRSRILKNADPDL